MIGFNYVVDLREHAMDPLILPLQLSSSVESLLEIAVVHGLNLLHEMCL